MKNLNTLKKAAPLLLLLPLMGSAIASELVVPLKFKVLPAIDIQQKKALAFGDVLSLTQADSCIMSATASTSATPLSSSDEGADFSDTAIYTSAGDAGTGAGKLTADCAGAADGQVGIYEITSGASAKITVSVTAGTPTDITFTPIGYVTDLDLAKPTRETLTIGTDADVEASAALSAYGFAGTNRAIIGGTIKNNVGLKAGAPYETDFNLNVVYQ